MKNIFGKMITMLTWMAMGSSLIASAETLDGQASLVVHQKDLTQYVVDETAKWLTPNQILADSIEIQKPYHSWINQLMYQGSAALNWNKDATTSTWSFDGTSTNVTLLASSFEVHDTIVVSSGGSSLSVRIDAVCNNVQLSLPGTYTIHGELPVNWVSNALQAPLQNFSMTLSPTVPVLTMGACTGPTGIQQLLQQQITQMFGQPAQLQAMIQNALQNTINGEVAKISAPLMKPLAFAVMGVQTTFTPAAISNLTSGSWIIDGALDLVSPNGTGVTTVAKGYTLANLSDVRASGLVFGNGLVSQILAFGSRSGLYQKDFSSQDVPSFQDFIANRMEQLLVWLDMWNFPTSAIFNFHAAATGTATLQSMTNTFPGVSFAVSSPVNIEMDAPTSKGQLPYVDFVSKGSSVNLQTKAVNGALNVTYFANSLNFTYGYYKAFTQKVRMPSYGIDVGTIEGEVQKSLTAKTVSFTMPDSASPLPDYRLSFQDLIFGKKTFRLEMAVQKK
jgi:hypothetical protein